MVKTNTPIRTKFNHLFVPDCSSASTVQSPLCRIWIHNDKEPQRIHLVSPILGLRIGSSRTGSVNKNHLKTMLNTFTICEVEH